MTETVAITAEAPAESAQKGYDKNNDQNRTKRHSNLCSDGVYQPRRRPAMELPEYSYYLIAFDFNALPVDLDVDAALAFLVIEVACADRDNHEDTDQDKK